MLQSLVVPETILADSVWIASNCICFIDRILKCSIADANYILYDKPLVNSPSIIVSLDGELMGALKHLNYNDRRCISYAFSVIIMYTESS